MAQAGRILTRPRITAGLFLVLLVLAGWRFADTAGLLRRLEPLAPGPCMAIAGFDGPEDIVVDPERRLAYVTNADRRGVTLNGTPPDGAIMLLSLADGAAAVPQRLEPLPPETFFPHGLDLWIGADGERRLFVVNHGRDGHAHAVEIFRVSDDGHRLVHIETIRSSTFIDPNDIVAVGPRQFYLTNLHGSRSSLARKLEGYLMLPLASAVYYDGARAREVVKGLAMANGIARSADGSRIYIAEITGRAVNAFFRAPGGGTLGKSWRLELPMGVDNLSMDADGVLWAAGHPRLLAISARLAGGDAPSPSEVIRIDGAGGDAPTWETVYLDDGRELSAASVAVHVGGQILIGAVFGDKVLDCRLP
ncbi:MAG: strictosidine synthase family protein [Rhodothalassiaceae bacterium]